MILDSLCTLSDAQDIHAGSCASTYSYDCGTRHNYDDAWNPHTGNQNVGNGRPVKVSFTLNDIVGVGADNPTLQVAIQQSTDNATWTNLIQSAVLSLSTLTSMGAGTAYQFDMSLPEGPIEEYLQAYYTIGGTAGGFTSIHATAAIVLDEQTNGVW